jgi:hypothetical protein
MRTIAVQLERSGIVQRDGWFVALTDGVLAVVQLDERRYTVTHVETGQAAGRYFSSQKKAHEAATWLWSQLSQRSRLRLARATTGEDAASAIPKSLIRSWHKRYGDRERVQP